MRDECPQTDTEIDAAVRAVLATGREYAISATQASRTAYRVGWQAAQRAQEPVAWRPMTNEQRDLLSRLNAAINEPHLFNPAKHYAWTCIPVADARRIAALLAAPSTVAQGERQAVELLRDWCKQVSEVGTGWDDWSHCYKAASRYLNTEGDLPRASGQQSHGRTLSEAGVAKPADVGSSGGVTARRDEHLNTPSPETPAQRPDVRLFATPQTERESLLQAALGLARAEIRTLRNVAAAPSADARDAARLDSGVILISELDEMGDTVFRVYRTDLRRAIDAAIAGATKP